MTFLLLVNVVLHKRKSWTEISRFDVALQMDREPLGDGSSGVVHLALWHGARAAVKIMADRYGTMGHKVRPLLKEIRLHQSIHHEFITQLYGASTLE